MSELDSKPEIFRIDGKLFIEETVKDQHGKLVLQWRPLSEDEEAEAKGGY